MLKETVGRANVGRSWGVSVGRGVFVGGTASAVCVNCAENCATVVPTIAVLMALTSSVGDGSAPTLQAVSIRAAVSSISRVCRGNLRKNIMVTSIQVMVNLSILIGNHGSGVVPNLIILQRSMQRDGYQNS